jgi:hypothetical protein
VPAKYDAGTSLVSSKVIDRLVRMRPWLSETRRPDVDTAIRKDRLQPGNDTSCRGCADLRDNIWLVLISDHNPCKERTHQLRLSRKGISSACAFRVQYQDKEYRCVLLSSLSDFLGTEGFHFLFTSGVFYFRIYLAFRCAIRA